MANNPRAGGNDMHYTPYDWRDVMISTGKRHELKTVQPWFDQVWAGVKPFEVRRDDRGFKKGDTFVLREYDDSDDSYSGRTIEALIASYFTLDPADGRVVLGLVDVRCFDENGNEYARPLDV